MKNSAPYEAYLFIWEILLVNFMVRFDAEYCMQQLLGCYKKVKAGTTLDCIYCMQQPGDCYKQLETGKTLTCMQSAEDRNKSGLYVLYEQLLNCYKQL
ncbi:hypothetical protein PoB_003004800 [Plakobranchus ocellatus]|uniref:Uncharacterized protein n=1 Tax=Plakobranchus ocellatus TaxID=259542 RepID=A0AAV4A9W0_9GAST|nr:hypothetical protein PoB_003004800 [Plakobranchus ocellatus]